METNLNNRMVRPGEMINRYQNESEHAKQHRRMQALRERKRKRSKGGVE